MATAVSEVTVGIDIGTTSVKAVAADADGRVVRRSRRTHDLVVPAPDRLEHRPDQAWRAGVEKALDDVAAGVDVAGVVVAAMVPSMCAVDDQGRALTPGLLYGDARGSGAGGDPSTSGESLGFARWCVENAPGAAGLWPAQAVANHALCGEGLVDSTTAMTMVPLFDPAVGWDADVAGAAAIRTAQLPRVVAGDGSAGVVVRDGPAAGAVLGGGTIDALGEQLVAGADGDGDVLVILGATLISWAVVPEWREVDGLWTIPHTAAGKSLIGGPSNAGGLFVDWAGRLAGDAAPTDDPGRVPVWAPYPRGERVPLHDPDRRAELSHLDLTHGPGAVVRAAQEAGGFVVRQQLELAGLSPRRIVATGGGTRSHGWVQAIADCTGLPVDVVAVPEGAALGAAFQARVAAGLESRATDARRWARTGHRVDPDPAWIGPVEERYARFLVLSATDR
jgi:xylulokinase